MQMVLRGILIFIIAIVFVASLALLYRAYRQNENAQAFAIPSHEGINEAMFIHVGGIEQWITIRGQDRRNPVILLLHGGPGLATSMLGEWFVPWEKQFTIVQWDQRGSGKTFGRYGRSTPNMTMSRIVSDGLEVANFLRHRLHKNKIIILGHSWGSMLGISMATARPEFFSAYVGMGQVVGLESETAAYNMALASAQRAGDRKDEAALRAIGPPPYRSVDQMVAARNLQGVFAPAAERKFLARSVPTALFAPGYTLGDIYANAAGGLYSLAPLYQNMMNFDARKLEATFPMPVIFIQGSVDTATPTPVVRSYFDTLTAPNKQFILLAGDGHLALLTDTNRVLDELVLHVRPLADSPSAN
jgi:pimeloyl-ACP methyl ester carboxylesterase